MAPKSGKRKVPAHKAREIQNQNRIERRAALSTGLLFTLLFIGFLFLSLRSSVPEPQQKGVRVMLGTDQTGTSQQLKDIQEATDKQEDAEKLKTPEAEQAEETQTAKAAENQAPAQPQESSVTQEDKPAPEMKVQPSSEQPEQKQEKEQAKTQADKGDGDAKEAKTKEKRKPNEKAMFTPSDNNKGQQKEDGQQGQESGDKDVQQPTEQGESTQDEQGISFSLEGRSITQYPSVEDQSQKRGKVVVEITVNERGQVIKAVPGVRGSTVTDRQLKKLAKKAALETEFNENQNGPKRQVGKMTINFKLQ